MSSPNTSRPSAPAPASPWAAAYGSIQRFLRTEDGPTAVEYAVMLALILASIFGTIGAVGGAAGGMFADSKTKLNAAGF